MWCSIFSKLSRNLQNWSMCFPFHSFNWLNCSLIEATFTWEVKWTHTGLRFQTGVKTSSVYTSKDKEMTEHRSEIFNQKKSHTSLSSFRLSMLLTYSESKETFLSDLLHWNYRLASSLVSFTQYNNIKIINIGWITEI